MSNYVGNNTDMEIVANEMKAVAKEKPILDYNAFMNEVRGTKEGVVDQIDGTFLRVRDGIPEVMKQYTRFIKFNIFEVYQLAYYEINVPQLGWVRQLSICQSGKMPISEKNVEYFVQFFFEEGEYSLSPTPPHIILAIQHFDQVKTNHI